MNTKISKDNFTVEIKGNTIAIIPLGEKILDIKTTRFTVGSENWNTEFICRGFVIEIK